MLDKVVLITGASSGIGAASARALARAGAKVTLFARRQGLLTELALDRGLAERLFHRQTVVNAGQHRLGQRRVDQIAAVIVDIAASADTRHQHASQTRPHSSGAHDSGPGLHFPLATPRCHLKSHLSNLPEQITAPRVVCLRARAAYITCLRHQSAFPQWREAD